MSNTQLHQHNAIMLKNDFFPLILADYKYFKKKMNK